MPNHEVIPGEFQPFAIDFMSPGNGNYLLEFIVGAPGGDSTLLLDAVSIVPKGQPDPFPAIPICWPIHVYKTPAPPTIDGVINVASEYPASRVQPVDLRLSTLAATDPYGTSASLGREWLDNPLPVLSTSTHSGQGMSRWPSPQAASNSPE